MSQGYMVFMETEIELCLQMCHFLLQRFSPKRSIFLFWNLVQWGAHNKKFKQGRTRSSWIFAFKDWKKAVILEQNRSQTPFTNYPHWDKEGIVTHMGQATESLGWARNTATQQIHQGKNFKKNQLLVLNPPILPTQHAH